MQSMASLSYIHDPAEIYRQSFAAIGREADLSRLPESMQDVAVRLIHACGMVDVVEDLQWSDGAVEAGRSALEKGGAVFTDVEMVRAGIISRNLPADNELICNLNREDVAGHAKAIGNTRSAAAVDFWDDAQLSGALVVIGNAPTALFRLLERLDGGAPKPALVIAMPVGFVGAVESKQEIAANPRGVPFITLHGRRGGSAIASAAFNAVSAGLKTGGPSA